MNDSRNRPVFDHFARKVQKRFEKSKNQKKHKKSLRPKSINECKKFKRRPAVDHRKFNFHFHLTHAKSAVFPYLVQKFIDFLLLYI